MNDSIVSQALSWGFICDLSVPSKWQILPQQAEQGWRLQLVGDRWLLIVNDVPQILCHPSEVTVFLERRCLARKRSTLRNLLLN
ncbi:hypothetical protein B7486_44665 [cyanobacterium TDX16]|nr:hypothetical protein B7486_44665 [cyanobacterium TDX16]